ncbi:CynX/NimT family MFS transporter [Spirillospora albida]|uniref:CynX/NimT family MFS transporter n=1 Tax=Spirillospora albida TaxID=58123 RepID=UPI001FDEED0E|nr:MFS transporter [Spirillospora albida]
MHTPARPAPSPPPGEEGAAPATSSPRKRAAVRPAPAQLSSDAPTAPLTSSLRERDAVRPASVQLPGDAPVVQAASPLREGDALRLAPALVPGDVPAVQVASSLREGDVVRPASALLSGDVPAVQATVSAVRRGTAGPARPSTETEGGATAIVSPDRRVAGSPALDVSAEPSARRCDRPAESVAEHAVRRGTAEAAMRRPAGAGEHVARPRSAGPATAWALVGLVLLTINLRAAITGIPPLLAELRDVFGLTGVQVGLLTTLPVLCLGVFASLAPVLARRFGAEAVIAGALMMITVGIVLRVVAEPIALFLGTVVAGAGIALGNVLMPSIIKRVFPSRVGSLTGLTMTVMAASGALAAGIAVPLDQAGGWRLALAVWAVPSLVAALVWGPLALRARTAPDRAVRTPPAGAEGSLLRSPLAWYIAAFMGLASLMFYVLMSWFPEIMRDGGHSPAAAGMMVSSMLVVGLPLGYAVPVLAARLRDQRPLVAGIGATMVIGIGGMAVAPSAGWVWVVALGIGTGSAFPLAYTLLNLRSPSPSVAARLSGMAQTAGYLLAGFGPLAIGVLHDATGGWNVPLVLLLVLLIPKLTFGFLAARPGHVQTRPVEKREVPFTQPMPS